MTLQRAVVTAASYLTGYIIVVTAIVKNPGYALGLGIMFPNLLIMTIIYFLAPLAKLGDRHTGIISLVTGGLMGFLTLYIISSMLK